MWLSRLDLLSFGRFTNVKLALGPGFHLVYGPNEAGKSTTLRAIRQLLFGFDERTTDNFVHSNPQLRIGGVVCDESGLELEVIRRKSRKDSLRAGDDTAIIDPKQWQDLISQVDETTFRQRYGIDYEQLVEGGRQIATGSGDLGEILFATGSGVMDLSAVRKGLADEAAEIFRPQGKKQRLNQAIAEWQQRKDLVVGKLLSVSTWEETDRLRQEAKARLDAITVEWARLTNECELYRRWKKALPLVTELDSLEGQLVLLPPARPLPTDFGEKRRNALLLLEQATEQSRTAMESISQAQREIDRLDVPDRFLSRVDEIARIVVEWGSYQKAQQDRPNLVEQHARRTAAVTELLRTIGHLLTDIDPSDIVLDRSLRTRIGLLGRQYAALLQLLTDTQSHHDRLRDQASAAQSILDSMPVDRPLDDLREAVRKAHADGDLEAQLDFVRREIATRRRDVSEQFQRLGPSVKSIADLEGIRIPAPEICQQFENDLDANQAELSLLQKRLLEFESELKKLDRQIEKLRQEFQVPTEADLETARRRRGEIWLEMRKLLNGNIVPAESLRASFEKSLDETDRVADRLRHEADRVAQLAEQLSDQAENETQQHETSVRLAELEAIRLDILHRWGLAWPDLDDVPALPRETQAWLLRRETLLQNQTLAQRREVEADELTQRIETHIASLSRLMADGASIPRKSAKKASKTSAVSARPSRSAQHRLFDEDFESNIDSPLPDTIASEQVSTLSGSLKDLFARAEELLAAHQVSTQRRLEAEERTTELKCELSDAVDRANSAKSQVEEWRLRWQAAMSEIKLAPDVLPDVAEAYLVTLGELADHRQQADQLRERISGIDSDAEQFLTHVKTLCIDIAPDLAEKPVGDAVNSLAKRLSACQRDESIRNQQSAKRDQARRQFKNAKDLARRGRDLVNELCLAADIHVVIEAPDDENVPPQLSHVFEQLESAEQQSMAQDQLQEKIKNVRDRLTEVAGEEPVAQFVERVRQQTPEDLESKLRTLEVESAGLAVERDRLNQQLGGFDLQLRQMDGSGDAADAEEDRRVWRAQIRSDAEEYIRLKLASSVLHTAIERYREKTRGPVLKRASEMFRELTLGSFEGLRVDEDDNNRPLIVGIKSGSRDAVSVGGMSEGTCDQLYLALRIASLELETSPRCHLPFIVDDILIQFDDARAAAALRIFARLGRRRQVVFFTHHEHLLEIANQCIPGEHVSHRLEVG